MHILYIAAGHWERLCVGVDCVLLHKHRKEDIVTKGATML